jgi:hypothetical protein
MSCEQFEGLVHPLVRLDLLDTDLREKAFAHARICADCNARLSDAQALAEASDAARQSSIGFQTPLYVEAGLMLAYREQNGQIAGRKRTANFVAVAAAACILVVGVARYAEWSRTTSRQNHVAGSAQGLQPAQNATALAPSSSQQGVLLPEAQKDSPNDADQLANFVPVPFSEETNPDDPGVIVRVQLTRAALGKLGYQVEQGKGKELVQADVLVGEDGWPRAVRLEQ